MSHRRQIMNNYTWEREPQQSMKQLEWQDLVLTQNGTNDETTADEITKICIDNADKMVNLTNYMVDTPLFVQTTDKLSKVLHLFRHM